jgi:DNA-binding MarR family transcriptional regulator
MRTTSPRRDEQEEALLLALRRLLRRVELSSAELEAAHGVTQPQLLCLRALSVNPSMTLGELSHEVRLSPSTLVGVVDRLEAKGLAERTRDRDDRRRIHITATAAGKAKATKAPEPLHLRTQTALASIPPTALATTVRVLERLVLTLDAAGDSDDPVLTSGAIPKPAADEATRPPR